MVILQTLAAQLVQADEFTVVKQGTNISYSIVKYKGLPVQETVEGALTPESLSTISGKVTVSNLSNFSDLAGEIIIADPYFFTDSAGRDEHVKEAFSKGQNKSIKIKLSNNLLSYDESSHLLKGKTILIINDIQHEVRTAAKIAFKKNKSGRNFAMIVGKMILNRKDFDVTITGLASVGDGFIENPVLLRFKILLQQAN